jgi:hypothetical protein
MLLLWRLMGGHDRVGWLGWVGYIGYIGYIGYKMGHLDIWTWVNSSETHLNN